jgi:glycosyltransferase involved in cell wall biosynthesis
MKVLFITRKWPPAVGGMEVYNYELVNELRGRTTLDLRKLPGRPDGRPPSFWSLTEFGFSTALALLAKRNDCDVVHGGDMAVWPLVWFATLRNRRIHPILSAHGTDIALAHRRGVLAGLYRVYVSLGAWLLPSVVILANSEATASLCRNIRFRSVLVVPLAARIKTDMPAAPESFLLFAGRLVPRKGCAWFIRKVLPKLNPEFKLVVAGTVWDADEKKALDNPRVDFRGPLRDEDLNQLYRTAMALVIPNTDQGINGFEGFGLSATEGAAAGGVVLASRLHGICEAVKDGVTGFLLPSGDAQAWAEKLEEISLWTPAQRRRFIDYSRASVANFYSWSRVADETLSAYRVRQVGASRNAESLRRPRFDE